MYEVACILSFVLTPCPQQYTLIKLLFNEVLHEFCRAPSILEASLAEAAQSVLGSFSDKDPENHSAMWGMVLAFSKAVPKAWEAIDARKAVQPKLLAFFR